MKIGAYQFPVTGNIMENMSCILAAVDQAVQEGVELLVFPECAVTGYPPLEIPSPSSVDEALAEKAHRQLRDAAVRHHIFLLAGTILRRDALFYNAALFFAPDGSVTEYDKRALWGWDRENFEPGSLDGIVQAGSLKLGIRICFEVRFPEYFRELYRAKTDLDIILFHDVSDHADPERYDLIRGHIRTRAVENACPVLTVNTAGPFQSAPTLLSDASGRVLSETEPGKKALMVYSFEKKEPGFGELGRRTVSDSLV